MADSHAVHTAALQSGLALTASWYVICSVMVTAAVSVWSSLACLLMFLPQDIARATFCRLTEDIHTLKARYQEQHRLNDLKVLLPT